MENSLPRETREILRKLVTDIESVKSELQANASCENDRFDEADFWKKFVESTEAVSNEVTRLCMVFSDPPVPTNEECQAVANRIENVTRKFVSTYLGFPNAQGKFLRNALYQYVCVIVYAVKEICMDIESSRNERLRLVGNVLQNCKDVDQLPQNNKDAVLAVFQTEMSIIQDAKEELEDAIQNEREGPGDEIRHAFMQNGIRVPVPNRWSETDRVVVQVILSLVKLFFACLKRTSQCIEEKSSSRDEQSIAQLDEAGDLIKSSSAIVDDLVSALYPPVSHSALLHYTSLLKSKIINLLTLLEHAHFSFQVDCVFANMFRDAAESYWNQIHHSLVPE